MLRDFDFFDSLLACLWFSLPQGCVLGARRVPCTHASRSVCLSASALIPKIRFVGSTSYRLQSWTSLPGADDIGAGQSAHLQSLRQLS
jgi:hypothetical protein